MRGLLSWLFCGIIYSGRLSSVSLLISLGKMLSALRVSFFLSAFYVYILPYMVYVICSFISCVLVMSIVIYTMYLLYLYKGLCIVSYKVIYKVCMVYAHMREININIRESGSGF